MKKAKIMLLTIAVFAVVGGTLAFKSAKVLYFPDANGDCTISSISREAGGSGANVDYDTTRNTDGCDFNGPTKTTAN